MLQVSTIFVIPKGSVYFVSSIKNSARTVLPFELYLVLSMYNTQFMMLTIQ